MTGLLSGLKRKAIRESLQSPEEIRAEQARAAEDRVTRANRMLCDLRAEWDRVNAEHQIGIQFSGFFVVGQSCGFAECAEIRQWYYGDWRGRMNQATEEFRAALNVWAGLKGTQS